MDQGSTLDVRSVVDALRAQLQSRIVSGAIAPGSAMGEETVAQMYKVARPSAKAAIEQLVHLGLLRRLPNKTARVPLMDEDDIADIFLSRTAVEQAAVVVLARLGAVPPAAEAALERLRVAGERGGSVIEIVASDVDFHRALIVATGSPRLARLHEAVIGEAHLCMAQAQRQHLIEPETIALQHRRILEAIGRGDPERAAEKMRSHLTSAASRLTRSLRQTGGGPDAGATPARTAGRKPRAGRS